MDCQKKKKSYMLGKTKTYRESSLADKTYKVLKQNVENKCDKKRDFGEERSIIDYVHILYHLAINS